MTLSTVFTEMFGVRYPIALAPMGGSAGGALAAAVSRGGGFGFLGGAFGDPEWLAREVPIIAGTDSPWGIGFLTWGIDVAAVERALEYGPRAVMLSFGDPSPYAERVRRAGALLILQVTDLEEAEQAVDLGADVIVAQGTESGGARSPARALHVAVRAGGRGPCGPGARTGSRRDRRRPRRGGRTCAGRRRSTHRHPLPGHH
ncbi:nitronate monooxygenase [Streptomyces sp. NPDC058175]|uniref:nitronate monooxygenase n=1 Tax=Streptomyces sp. NPDC058175 TaxID=3346367 RepID=UPI0036E85B85